MQERIEGLKKRMKDGGIDAAFIMHPRSLYYYAGTSQPCNLVVTLKEEPLLYVRRAWDFVKKETPLENLKKGGSLGDISKYLESLGIREGVLGMEEDVLPARLYNKTRDYFPSFQLKNISPLIMDQRLIKDREERKLVEKASSLFSHIHEVILNNLKPGVKEVELAGLLWSKIRQEGHEGFTAHRRWDGFLPGDGIVASGENLWQISGYAMTVTGTGKSKYIPWGSSDRVIQEGELVVVDVATNYQGYHGDTARTYVAGKASEKQKEVYASLSRVMEEILSHIREGVNVKDLYHLAEKAAEREGYQDYFQGYASQKGEYIGHGLGLEVDEPPVLGPQTDLELKEGMILALEPKFIIPDWGAVDVEETLCVTREGCQVYGTVERKLYEVY